MRLLRRPASIQRIGTSALARIYAYWILTAGHSQIILALLSTGEAYLVDLRKQHRGRVELFEVQDESDEEAQMSAPRLVSILLCCSSVTELCNMVKV